jgi:hypothetical protein
MISYCSKLRQRSEALRNTGTLEAVGKCADARRAKS